MDDADMEIMSAPLGRSALSVTSPRFTKAFSGPSGNVVFKTSDYVTFRVEDYYLKATR